MKIKKLSSLVSIAFTGTRLHAAQMRRSGNRVQVVRSMQAALALDPLNNDPQLVGRELRRHLTEAGISEKRCVISLPLRWAFVLPVDLPELPEADRASFLALQAERSFPFAPEELSQATNWLAPRRATIIAMPLNYLSKLQSALTATGLKVVSITLGITSLIDMDSPSERRDGIDLLVGSEGLEMAVRAGSGYAALRPLDDAMERDTDAAQFDAEMMVRQMRITLGQLPADLLEGVKTIHVQGPESLTRPLIEQLRPLLPRLSLTLEAGHEAGATAQDAVPQVVGAGARALRGLAAAVELLPPKHSRWGTMRKQIASRRSAWLGGMAAVILFGAGGAFGWQSIQLSQLDGTWQAMATQVRAVQDLQKQVQQYQPWFEDDPQSLRILNELTGAFPKQGGTIWATSVVIKNMQTVNCSGRAVNAKEFFAMTDQLGKDSSIKFLDPPKLMGGADAKDPNMQFTISFSWKARTGNGN